VGSIPTKSYGVTSHYCSWWFIPPSIQENGVREIIRGVLLARYHLPHSKCLMQEGEGNYFSRKKGMIL